MKIQSFKLRPINKILMAGSALVLSSSISCFSMAATVFNDVSEAAGVDDLDFRTSTNHSMGLNWIDFDNDGWEDIFVVNGFGQDPHLYRNNQDGTFTLADELLPAMPNVEMTGSYYADYDNDGDSDIYIGVANEVFNIFDPNDLSGPANMLLKNMFVENGNKVIDGQPLFVDVAEEAGVTGVQLAPIGVYPASNAYTGGWLDYDRDGCVDLYVGQLVLQAAGDEANINNLYKNNCDGTFTDVTHSSGSIGSTNADDLRPSLIFIGAHLDNDLDPDMYVGNVHEVAPHHFDFLHQNNADGTFSETSHLSPGLGDDAGSGMGIDVSDIDLDGDWDIYIADLYSTTNDELPFGSVLYLSNGDGTWAENSAIAAGVEGRFSWGADFFDMNNNGFEDLYVTCEDNDLLYQNNGDGTFTDIADAAGINQMTIGRGAVSADYDKDGDLDMAVVTPGFPLILLRNDSTEMGNWLQLTLQGVQSNRDAIGALVKLTVDDKTLMRQVISASSTHSQAPLTLHFGLGSAEVATEVTVYWPSGVVDIYNSLDANNSLTLVEGETVVPALAITSVEPSTVNPLSSVEITITGEGFNETTDCLFFQAPTIGIVRKHFVDANTFKMTVLITPGTPAGKVSLGCTNQTTESARLRGAIEVL